MKAALSLVFLSTSAASIVSNSTNTTSLSPQTAILIQFPSQHLRGSRNDRILLNSTTTIPEDISSNSNTGLIPNRKNSSSTKNSETVADCAEQEKKLAEMQNQIKEQKKEIQSYKNTFYALTGIFSIFFIWLTYRVVNSYREPS